MSNVGATGAALLAQEFFSNKILCCSDKFHRRNISCLSYCNLRLSHLQLSKTSSDLSKMAAIYLVDVDQTPVYTQYFDISYIPSTVFFFNGQHMKVDYG